MEDNETLLKAIRSRKAHHTEFGYGIGTADSYLKRLQESIGLSQCYKYLSTRSRSFRDLVKRAEHTLVYSNPEMELEEKEANASRFPSILQGAPQDLVLPKNSLVVFRHTLTSSRKDRDGDQLHADGAIVDPSMLMLWQHIHTSPIGKFLYVASQNPNRLKVVSCIVDMNALSHDAAVMVDNDMARFSHGFRAIRFTETKEGRQSKEGSGFDVKEFEIMEESLVSVPANVDATTEEVLLGMVESKKLTSPLMKTIGRVLREKRGRPVHQGITLVDHPDGTRELAVSSFQDLKAAADAGLIHKAEGLKEKSWSDAAREAAAAARRAVSQYHQANPIGSKPSRGSNSSLDANDYSETASRRSEVAGRSGEASFHDDAARSHSEAAKWHGEAAVVNEDDPDSARAHQEASDAHHRAAQEHFSEARKIRGQEPKELAREYGALARLGQQSRGKSHENLSGTGTEEGTKQGGAGGSPEKGQVSSSGEKEVTDNEEGLIESLIQKGWSDAAREASAASRKARMASKLAHDSTNDVPHGAGEAAKVAVSVGAGKGQTIGLTPATTSGGHEMHRGDHAGAAEAHQRVAEAHRAEAAKASDPSDRAGHLNAAQSHEEAAKLHGEAAAAHADASDELASESHRAQHGWAPGTGKCLAKNSSQKAKDCGHMNKDGTFKGGFDGCVLHFTECEGKSEEQAKGLCGKIARAVGAAPGGKSAGTNQKDKSLVERLIEKATISNPYQSEPGQGLTRLLGCLKALHWNHQTLHWQSSGDEAYQSHLLFQRLYEDVDILGEADSLAEKIVARLGPSAVDPSLVEFYSVPYQTQWEQIPDPYTRALQAERDLQGLLRVVHDPEDLGLDNLLAQIADTHDTSIYLLQQRLTANKSLKGIAMTTKAGRALNSKNKGLIQKAKDHVEDVAGQEYLQRPHSAQLKQASQHLSEVLESAVVAEPDGEAQPLGGQSVEGKPRAVGVRKAMGFVLAYATPQELKDFQERAALIQKSHEQEAITGDFSELIGEKAKAEKPKKPEDDEEEDEEDEDTEDTDEEDEDEEDEEEEEKEEEEEEKDKEKPSGPELWKNEDEQDLHQAMHKGCTKLAGKDIQAYLVKKGLSCKGYSDDSCEAEHEGKEVAAYLTKAGWSHKYFTEEDDQKAGKKRVDAFLIKGLKATAIHTVGTKACQVYMSKEKADESGEFNGQDDKT